MPTKPRFLDSVLARIIGLRRFATATAAEAEAEAAAAAAAAAEAGITYSRS